MAVNEKTNFFAYVNNYAKHEKIKSTFVFQAENYYSANITFVIPTFKRINTLKDTLDSVLCQKGNYNFTIIVIDNNPSRDDVTESFMEDYELSNVSYVKNNNNLGMAGNWNRGIALSKSKWVCLLHDDDTITQDFLIEMMPYIESIPDAAIIQSRKYRTEGPDIIPKKNWDKEIQRYRGLDFIYYHIIDVPSGILYNRDILIKEGGFNPDFFPSIDYAFHIKLAFKYKVYVINKYLTWYREGEQNASKLIEIQKGWIIVDFYIVYQLLSKYGIPSFVILPFLEYKTIRRASVDQKIWKTSFEIPYDKLIWNNYTNRRRTICYYLINKIIRIYQLFFHCLNNNH